MILASLGKFSVAQTLTGTEISENVISMPAHDWAGFTDLWWFVSTTTAATTAGIIQMKLIMSTAEALTAGAATRQVVDMVYIAAITETRVATIGRTVHAVNVGKMISQMMETLGDTFIYLGMEVVCAGSTEISLDASLTPYEPRTSDHKLVVVSNVTVPAVASPGSGF